MENILIFEACAPPRCHCPKLVMDDDACTIQLFDDYEGVVKMTYEEFAILARNFLEHQ